MLKNFLKHVPSLALIWILVYLGLSSENLAEAIMTGLATGIAVLQYWASNDDNDDA